MVSLALNAMATRFELVLHGAADSYLRAAGEEAMQEVERWERLLSAYLPNSEISRINMGAATDWVRISPEVFAVLQQCRDLHQLTKGAFDITIGPLMQCWGLIENAGERPTSAELNKALLRVGLQSVELDEECFAVRFTKPSMRLDLGAIGKGVAIDRAIQLLRDNEVTHALLHGGTSTAFALGNDPRGGPWKIRVDKPIDMTRPTGPKAEFATVELCNEA